MAGLDRRSKLPGHALQNLGFDRQHDYVGIGGDIQIIGAGMDAKTTVQQMALFGVRLGDPELARVATAGDQSADQTAGHVAAADKGNGGLFHLHLVGLRPE